MKNSWLWFWRGLFLFSFVVIVVLFFARQRQKKEVYQNEFIEIFEKTEFAGKNNFFVFQVREILVDSLSRDFYGRKLEKNSWYFFRDSSMYPLKEATKKIIDSSCSDGISVSFEVYSVIRNRSGQPILDVKILNVRNFKQENIPPLTE